MANKKEAAGVADPCAADCVFEGRTANCTDRMSYLSENSGAATGEDACASARAVVTGQCAVCKGCQYVRALCPAAPEATPALAPEPATTAEEPPSEPSPTPSPLAPSPLAPSPLAPSPSVPLKRTGSSPSPSPLKPSPSPSPSPDAKGEEVATTSTPVVATTSAPVVVTAVLPPAPPTMSHAVRMTFLCDNQCLFEQKSATCKDRILYAAQHNNYPSDPCGSATTDVQVQCEACKICSLAPGICVNPGAVAPPAPAAAAAGVASAAPASPLPTTTEPSPTTTTMNKAMAELMAEGCDASCTFEGTKATCGSRVTFAAKDIYKLEGGACQNAWNLVKQQCGTTCPGCTFEKAAPVCFAR